MADDDEIQKILNEYIDPDGEARRIANELGNILLSNDPDYAYSGLVAAAALLNCSPDHSKENAVELSRDLGKHVAEEVERNYDKLTAIRQRFESATEEAT